MKRALNNCVSFGISVRRFEILTSRMVPRVFLESDRMGRLIGYPFGPFYTTYGGVVPEYSQISPYKVLFLRLSDTESELHVQIGIVLSCLSNVDVE